jgi:hypothetical protein
MALNSAAMSLDMTSAVLAVDVLVLLADALLVEDVVLEAVEDDVLSVLVVE